jgi:GNAT superfamily N-acetyltransferase
VRCSSGPAPQLTETIDLDILCVDTETARSGAGTFLFKHVLAQARAQKLPIYLDAAPTGSALPFWTRHGFRQLGVIQTDGMDDVIAMVREDDSEHLIGRLCCPAYQ